MKKLSLRKVVALSLMVLCLCFIDGVWAAEEKYPSRFIELWNGYPAGGAAEIHNRLLAGALKKHLNIEVVPISKPGGGGVLACTQLINAAPDGYTVCQLSFNSICQTVVGSNGKITLDDIRVIGQWNGFGSVMAVAADSPLQTFQEVVDKAKKEPGYRFAHPGIGNSTYLRMQNLNKNAGLKMVGVPFKGDAEVITALLGHHLPVGIFSAFSAKMQAEAGKIRILFSFDPPDAYGLDPKTPYLAGYFDKDIADKDIDLVGFMFVPAKTPDHIAEVLEKALEAASKEPELIEGLKKYGAVSAYLNSRESTEKLQSILTKVRMIKE
jgi:tripartite-type tricarboxylate transporter receptor subunit TctC